MKCACRSGIETNLSCSKCGRPICPKCLVQTPVGARCPSCANVHKLPTYSVPARYYLRASGAGLGVAVVGGFIWGLIEAWVPFFSLNLILAPAFGYAISEVVSLASNRKRGIGLAVVAGIALVVSYLVAMLAGIFLPWGFHFHLLDLLAIALGVVVAVARLR